MKNPPRKKPGGKPVFVRDDALEMTMGKAPDGRVYAGDREWFKAVALKEMTVKDVEPLLDAIRRKFGWLTYALPEAGLTWGDWSRIRTACPAPVVRAIYEAMEEAQTAKTDEMENVLMGVAKDVEEPSDTRVRAAGVLLKYLGDRESVGRLIDAGAGGKNITVEMRVTALFGPSVAQAAQVVTGEVVDVTPTQSEPVAVSQTVTQTPTPTPTQRQTTAQRLELFG